MPLYHFHVQDGRSFRDMEGTEMPDAVAARAECLKMAGQIITEAGMRGSSQEAWTFEVADEAGQPVCRMAFTAIMVRSPKR